MPKQITPWKKYSLISLPWIAVALFYIYITAIQPLLTPFIIGIDGTDYATLALHLAHHIGTYWSPEFTSTRFAHFYEHPPMGIWYYSIFYKIFGSSWHTDKIIAAFEALWIAIIILLFVRRDYPKASRWLIWLPILILFSNPQLYIFLDSNKFESIEFPLSFTVLYWISQCRWRAFSFKYLSSQSIIVGLVCVIGFEINGLLFLYVWAAYLICAITSDHLSIKKATILTCCLVASSLTFYGLLMWLVPAARHNNMMYFSTQLFPSLAGLRTDNSFMMHGANRIQLLGLYLRHISLWFVIAVAGWVLLELRNHYNTNKKSTPHHSTHELKNIQFYILLTAATTLPLFASSKVLEYYYLQVNGFLTLLLCCLIIPSLQSFYMARLSIRSFLVNLMLAPLFAYALSWPTIYYYHIFKQFDLGREAYRYTLILEHYLPKNSIVSAPPHILPHAIAYLTPNLIRFMNISMMAGGGCEYYLDSIYNVAPPPKGYHKIDTPMILLTLYKRDHSLPTCRPHKESLKEYSEFGHPAQFLI